MKIKRLLALVLALLLLCGCGAQPVEETPEETDEPEAGTGMLLEENKQEGSFIGGSGNSGVNFSAAGHGL